MPGTLFVVATPIGNLEDISLRALRVLREVQLIAAEDTRRTAKLLQHYGIPTPTTSVHEHNEYRKAGQLVVRLQGGDSIALVSDAGTPGVSDPGGRLVRAARDAGIPVVAVPGASAILTAFAAAGLEADGFTFAGFPPRRSSALKRWVRQELAQARHPVIFFEAPHRIRQTLSCLASELGDRPILVGRELTKLFESLVEQQISAHLRDLREPKGEFTVVVTPDRLVKVGQTTISDADLRREYDELVRSSGRAPRQAAKELAERHGLAANHVYAIIKRGLS